MCVSDDNLWLFTGDSLGGLKQYSALNRGLECDYGKAHTMAIKVLHVTQNSEFLLTAGLKGDIQVWSIRDAKLIKRLVKAHAFPITAIVSTKLCDAFISSDCVGNIKFWSLMEVHDEEKLTKSYLLDPDNIDMYLQFPKAHETGIFSMCITTDSKFVFSSDYNGNTKSWDIENGHMLVDYGKMNNSILVSLEPKLAIGAEDKSRRQTDNGMYGRKGSNPLDGLL